jgi:hypothetical protein
LSEFGKFKSKIKDRQSSAKVFSETEKKTAYKDSPRTASQKFYDLIEEYGDAVTTRNMSAIDSLFSKELSKYIKKRIMELKSQGLIMFIQHEGIEGGNPEEEVIYEGVDGMVIRYKFLDTSYCSDENQKKVKQNPGTEWVLLITLTKIGKSLMFKTIGVSS